MPFLIKGGLTKQLLRRAIVIFILIYNVHFRSILFCVKSVQKEKGIDILLLIIIISISMEKRKG